MFSVGSFNFSQDECKCNNQENLETMDVFHSTQNSGSFRWYINWNRPFRFGPTGIFGTSFEGGPLWPVWSFRSVGPKCLFTFDKIVVPGTALLHPAYKNNNQTRGGLGPVCATEMYRSDWAREISSRNFCWMETASNCYGKF